MAKSVLFFYIAICIICLCHSKSKDESKSDNDGEKWKKKDIRDYSEADMERLLEQWEVSKYLLCFKGLSQRKHLTTIN